MKRFLALMVLLLLTQLLLLVNSYRQDDDAGAADNQHTLLDVGARIVDELRLADHRGAELTLQRKGERWLLPGLGGLPADTARVEALIEQLTATDPGWPVAQTLAARQRFQVAEYRFRRRLTLLSQQGKLGEVYLGTAPVFRKVHARNALRDDIYSIPLSLFELPADAGKWLDPRLLQVRAPVAINADGYSLDRSSGEWLLGGGGRPDPRELDALLTALRELQVRDVASEQLSAALGRVDAELLLQVEALAGNVELALFEHAGEHYVRSSEYPQLFVISAYEFDKLTGIDSLLLTDSGPAPD